jgi:hypothetical protein
MKFPEFRNFAIFFWRATSVVCEMKRNEQTPAAHAAHVVAVVHAVHTSYLWYLQHGVLL